MFYSAIFMPSAVLVHNNIYKSNPNNELYMSHKAGGLQKKVGGRENNSRPD